jgi:hypothetical protein
VQVKLQFHDDPAVESTLSDALGRVYVSFGMHDTARPMLETALETRERLYGDGGPEVAQSLQSLVALAAAGEKAGTLPTPSPTAPRERPDTGAGSAEGGR